MSLFGYAGQQWKQMVLVTLLPALVTLLLPLGYLMQLPCESFCLALLYFVLCLAVVLGGLLFSEKETDKE